MYLLEFICPCFLTNAGTWCTFLIGSQNDDSKEKGRWAGRSEESNRRKPMITMLKNKRGQGVVEYSLILALISIAAIAVMLLLGPEIIETFSKVVSALVGANG